MQQIADHEFRYLGLGTFPSVCRLRAFAAEGAPTVVIATELPHNSGTSGTNAAQDIALIEHYEKDGEERFAQERFALVTFRHTEGGRFNDPKWCSPPKKRLNVDFCFADCH